MNTRNALHHSRKALQQLFDLLYPPPCAGCQRNGYVLCPTCLSQIHPLSSSFCQRCSSPLAASGICPTCQYSPLKVSGLRAVSTYQEPLRSCIHALKYNGNTRLAEPLGTLLAQTYHTLGMQADAIVPVPLHSQRHKRRGYNHAALLATVCAAQTGIPFYDNLILRHRATLAQVDLKPWERQQNVQGAFTCSPNFTSGQLHGRTILLIDDVCTTGATLEACAAPLFAAGARAVWGLVLARPIA